MNRSKIEWCDLTWSPITGCSRGCDYCYARRMAYRLRGRYGYRQDEPFAVTFHADRLLEPSKRKKPAKIFVCSMGEMFDPEAKLIWKQLIFTAMRWTPRHTFQILTKQVRNASQFVFPDNCWLGVSIDGKYTDSRDIRRCVKNVRAKTRFVSFEPLLGEITDLNSNLRGIDWIIIGGQTGPRAVPPEKEWVEDIINSARERDIPVFLKDNLHWKKQIREWPREEDARR